MHGGARPSPRACGRGVPLRVLRDKSILLPAHTLVAWYLALGRHLSYLGETFSTRFLEKNQNWFRHHKLRYLVFKKY